MLLRVLGLEGGFGFVDLLVGLVAAVRFGKMGGFVVKSFEHNNYYKPNTNHSEHCMLYLLKIDKKSSLCLMYNNNVK